MTEEIQTAGPADSSLPEQPGKWWLCICGRKEHAQFLPAEQVPPGRHGTYFDVDERGRRTAVVHWRIASERCAKSIGTAEATPVQKAPRKPAERGAERPVEAVREAGAA